MKSKSPGRARISDARQTVSRQVSKLLTPEILASSQFVTFEREKALKWEESGWVCLFSPQTLAGYKLAVVEDWVLNESRLNCAVAIKTGSDLDQVVVQACQLVRGSSSHVRDKFKNSFISPDVAGLSTESTPHGTIVTCDVNTLEKSNHIIDFPSDGDFDKHQSRLYERISLKRLGCGYETISLSTNPTVELRKLAELYDVASSISESVAVNIVVERIQAALNNLQMLSDDTYLPGVYDSPTRTAVSNFCAFAKYDEDNEVIGDMNLEIFQLLVKYIQKLQDLLSILNFFDGEDGFIEHELLHKNLREFQTTNGLKGEEMKFCNLEKVLQKQVKIKKMITNKDGRLRPTRSKVGSKYDSSSNFLSPRTLPLSKFAARVSDKSAVAEEKSKSEGISADEAAQLYKMIESLMDVIHKQEKQATTLQNHYQTLEARYSRLIEKLSQTENRVSEDRDVTSSLEGKLKESNELCRKAEVQMEELKLKQDQSKSQIAKIYHQIYGTEAMVLKWRLLYWALNIITPVVGKISEMAGRAREQASAEAQPSSVYNYLIRQQLSLSDYLSERDNQ